MDVEQNLSKGGFCFLRGSYHWDVLVFWISLPCAFEHLHTLLGGLCINSCAKFV